MKTRSDFVSNSSSCSFFVSLESAKDVEAFKRLVDTLVEKNVSMQMFCSLEEANDRWYGVPFDGSEQMQNALCPGYYVLIDTGDDHYEGYEERFNDIESLFMSEHAFKLYRDVEAHLSTGNDLPKV